MSESSPGSGAIQAGWPAVGMEVAHTGEEEDVLRSLRMRPFSEEFYTTPKMSRGMTTASLE